MTILKINGISLSVHVEGSGSPIVFVHGYTTTSRFWSQQIPALAARYQTVTFDLRGHGESTKQSDLHYNIPAFVEDLYQLLNYLNIGKSVLVGLSMGGTVVQQFALEHPERISGLVLVDTTAHGLGPVVQAENVLARIEAVGTEAASREVIVQSFSRATNRALVAWAETEVIKTPTHVAKEAILSLGTFDARQAIALIRIPTLIIVGAEDKITPPAESELMQQLIPDSQLAIIKGAAHFPMLEQPQAFNEQLFKFLQSIST